MNLVITGSLGNISRPLTKKLVQKGHSVIVISSKPEKKKDIETLGATAAIGSVEDVDFLTAIFTGADAVYCMIPPNHFAEGDPIAYFRRIGNSYAQAVQQSGVKRVVHLSTYGADLDQGTGLILGSHNVEKILNQLSGVSITHMRPTYFYYNVLAFVNMVKKTDTIAANYGADKVVMVSPIDIAAAVADEIVTPINGNNVRYVASDEVTGIEIASILGEAIGKPDLKWVNITDEQMKSNYEAIGVPPQIITGLVEMFASLRSGKLAEDYHRNEPAVMGKVKFKDYAKEFASIYQQK